MVARAIAVFGGAGYIGSHFCKALSRAGYQPVVFDNLSTGHEAACKFGPFFQGDVRSYQDLSSFFGRFDIFAAAHFAAKSIVGESAADPFGYWENNVLGTINLCRALREHSVRNLIFSSTAAVYGEGHHGAIPESMPANPINTYGRSKLAAENVVHSFAATGDFRFVIFRYFNAAGGDPEGEIGETHYPETHLIPRALRAQAPNADPLTVFGNDYSTPDGSCIRDFIHVSDLADAHVLGLRCLGGGRDSLILNLGTGRGTSVREVVAAVELATGKPMNMIVGPRRPGDPPVLVADSRFATGTLGWRPSRSNIDNIVNDAWLWLRSGKFAARQTNQAAKVTET